MNRKQEALKRKKSERITTKTNQHILLASRKNPSKLNSKFIVIISAFYDLNFRKTVSQNQF